MVTKISSHCPKCQAPLRLPSSSVPLKFRCQTCGHIFVAPPTEPVALPSVTVQPPPTVARATESTSLTRSPLFLVPLALRSSKSNVRVGQTVATVGYPNPGLQGQEPKFTTGQINALSGAGDDAGLYQISVSVQPGNSGGPLLDEHGQVVGVIVAKLSVAAALQTSGQLPENVNYAIKESVLTAFLESVPGLVEQLPKATDAKELKPEDVAQLGTASAGMVVVYRPPKGSILN